MKKLICSVTFGLVSLAAVMPVFAEAGAREDNSMMLVYLFLATCGLIIFLQLIPVFTLLYGILRGVFSRKQDEVKPAPVKYR